MRANRMSVRAHPIKGPLFRKDKSPSTTELEYLSINAHSVRDQDNREPSTSPDTDSRTTDRARVDTGYCSPPASRANSVAHDRNFMSSGELKMAWSDGASLSSTVLVQRSSAARTGWTR